MRIAVGADGNGLVMKDVVKRHLLTLGHEVVDFGVHEGQDEDYPDVAEPVARAVAAGEFDRAVLVCGTGLGMAIVANKVRGVRAAPVTDPYSANGRSDPTMPGPVPGCQGRGYRGGAAAGGPLDVRRVRRWWFGPQGGQDRGP